MKNGKPEQTEHATKFISSHLNKPKYDNKNQKKKSSNRQQTPTKSSIADIVKKRTYPKMRFLGDWMQHINQMPRNEGDALLMAIAGYGLRELEPTEVQDLSPESLEYFNTEVRPELDRQHKRFNTGKKI